MGVDELDELLAVSRAWNSSVHITGLLLYKESQFMQVLEGPDDAVRKVLEKIGADSRHHNMRLLAEKQTDTRQFGQWSMGFRRAGDEHGDPIPGYEDFFAPPPREERASASREELLLEWFRTH